MDDAQLQKTTESGFEHWYSTYGLITAERVLGLLGFHLTHQVLVEVMHDEKSIYHELLKVPFKNVLNGIILSQASDYREYAQRLFLDYLSSGAANATESSTDHETTTGQGGTKDALEQERLTFLEMAEALDLDEFQHNKLIAESQRALIALSQLLRTEYAEDSATTQLEKIQKEMHSFEDKISALTQKLCEQRHNFYALILRIRNLFDVVSGYHPNHQKLKEHRVALEFDTALGRAEDH